MRIYTQRSMKEWYERGFIKKPYGYELMKLFPPHAYYGANYGGNSCEELDDKRLFEKFFAKYPEVKHFPMGTTATTESDGVVKVTHPAAVFIKKQHALIKKGYSEDAAFSMVEKDMHKFIQRQREEMRVLRGTSIGLYGESYLDRFQRVAEAESQMKVMRLERDLPKYLRSQFNWMKSLEENEQELASPHDKSEKSFERESIEEQILQKDTSEILDRDDIFHDPAKYQPVLYKIVRDEKGLRDTESYEQLHETFLQESEKLVKVHHQRAHIHDGLKNLSDKEILLRIRESPTKLKRASASFYKKLRKLEVSLTPRGEVDFSKVQNENVLRALQKNHALVRNTLMQADLNFEFPQKIEKSMIKADMLKMVEEEEAKLYFLAREKEEEEERQKVLTYDEYYGLNKRREADIWEEGYEEKKAKPSFQEYARQHGSQYLFDNDLLEQSYKFWESPEEKQQRLHRTWLEMKKKNAIGILERTSEDQERMNREVVRLTRKLRWKIDQELVRRDMRPVFKENLHTYSRKEFLLDADIEFSKIRYVLEKTPTLLQEDPLMSLEYLKIINLIKKAKLLEKSSNAYDPREAAYSHFLEPEVVETEEQREKRLAAEYQREQQMMDQTLDLGEEGGMGEDEDDTIIQSAKAIRKQELKDKDKIMDKFKNLAQVTEDEAKRKGLNMKPKKDKQKKEKTLSAKLRLKSKKGGK